MKINKLLLFFLFFPLLLNGQKFIGSYTKTDSLKVKIIKLIEQSSLTASDGKLIYYNDSLHFYNGSEWFTLGSFNADDLRPTLTIDTIIGDSIYMTYGQIDNFMIGNKELGDTISIIANDTADILRAELTVEIGDSLSNYMDSTETIDSINNIESFNRDSLFTALGDSGIVNQTMDSIRGVVGDSGQIWRDTTGQHRIDIDLKLNKSDTTGLSDRINLKLNNADLIDSLRPSLTLDTLIVEDSSYAKILKANSLYGDSLVVKQADDIKGTLIYGYDNNSDIYANTYIGEYGQLILDWGGTGADNYWIQKNSNLIMNISNIGFGAADNIYVYFGNSADAKFVYDGTNLLINPRSAGSGHTLFIDGYMAIGNITPLTYQHINISESGTTPTDYDGILISNSDATTGNLQGIGFGQSSTDKSLSAFIIGKNTDPTGASEDTHLEFYTLDDGSQKLTALFDSDSTNLYIDGAKKMSLLADSLRLEGIPITNISDPVNPQDAASKAYVDASSGGGEVDTFGLPVTNQVAYFTSANKIGGDNNFTWNDTVLNFVNSQNNVYITEIIPSSITVSNTDNVIIGGDVGLNMTTANNNVFVGYDAGDNMTSESRNAIIGSSAGNRGSDHAYLGYFAGANADGDKNIFIGSYSGNSNDGSNNISIGYQSGYTGNGSTNIFIGYQSGYSETGSNKLYIENSNSATPLIYGEFDNDIVKINGTQVQSTGTISDNDATPNVSAANVWTYAGSSNSVTITDLDLPDVGAIYRIIGNSDTYTITINDAGNFNLSGNWTGGIDDIITIFVQADNDYIEISRSDN